ncbi:hypothetical protein [Deinococcus enclensis]|uniref:Uncharacterized protein n=1 Tax=Deinococcus enclensis TaxID=1049582 RepID=A0ABT9MEW7_9DEIO|nr:hypothetical protein [Deinococcus enclensis]MDP9765151.1 hypothetical protein [Deinococcus enclensis]
MSAVFTSVVCNDTPAPQGTDYWVKDGNEQAVKYPLIGGSVTQNPCAFWGAPTTQKPATPAGMPALLMVQNKDDPACWSRAAPRGCASPRTAVTFLSANASGALGGGSGPADLHPQQADHGRGRQGSNSFRPPPGFP